MDSESFIKKDVEGSACSPFKDTDAASVWTDCRKAGRFSTTKADIRTNI
jgi:hypothetical protein